MSDTITMKNGIVYRSQGSPDRDGTLVFLWDGLKRTVIRDSKIERIVGDSALRTGEKFQIVQPLVVHAGAMPKEVISVQAGPWNDKGRRSFRYVGSNPNRPVLMEQALIEIGPHMVKYRGVDGFWLGQLATSQVPRAVIAGLLGHVEQNDQAERERAVRFLMDAGWYTEARAELDRLIHDFPRTDLAERAAGARGFIIQAAATYRRPEVDQCRRALQFLAASSLLKSFNEKEIGTELWIEVRDLMRRDDDLRAGDTALATELRKLEGKLPAATRGTWKKRAAEVAKALDEAPDAVRDRFGAWRKARAASSSSDESLLALATSGFVVGSDEAVSELKLADALWQARGLIHDYLAAEEASAREDIMAKLEGLGWPEGDGLPEGYRKLELATRLVRLMPPPLSDLGQEPGKSLLHKLNEDQEQAATEYIVRLPPEYHPLRSYPALLIMHSGQGPQSAVDAWAAEASRRGYIVIAPEYAVPGQPAGYHYSQSEHAAVELALRDALRRYAIDSDRVFIAGQLSGGNMAWDLALGHPDLFAGAIVLSGVPAYYVPRYLGQHERLPLYFVIGDLAPAATEVFFGNYLKPMILKGWDATYVEYHRRGLEEFPEEISTIFDWMDHHRRDPVPKSFDAATARTCDNRFYGVVVHEFSAGRSTAPEAVEILGQNLSPATLKMRTSALGNLLNLKSAGIMKLDVWVSPRIIDFKRKLEVRVNDKPRFKGLAPLLLGPLLEDLRLRGDRQQIYWMKVAVG
ncbi:MAG TPA: alpha/beta hydrolase [Isosphaeraceae bacterium]|nr:alpha/beta hydrolase [Isosphaeraceae bacterium]